LEQLHVLPNVSYLAKVRNTDELIEPATHHAAAAEEHAPATHGETAPHH
jgi:molybdopterin-containing oxidoreductase family iron-sulfur binding subunit